MDMVIKTGAVFPLFLRQPVAAVSDLVQLPDQLNRLLRRTRIRIGAEIERFILFHSVRV